MWTYRWCHLSIRSDFELPELPGGAGGIEWRITLEAGCPPDRAGREWFHQWAFPDGREWVAFARDRGGYLLRFPELADFDVVPAARTIGCHSQPSTPLHTLRHLLLDQVLPLVAGDPNRLAVHGSAVATTRGAVAFLGDPGDGKSTLAALLARRGCELLTDDCCLLARTGVGFDVVPAYPGVRLGPDSIDEIFGDADAASVSVAHYTAKRRIADDEKRGLRYRGQCTPVSRIYVLAPARDADTASVAIGRRTHRQALFDLLNCTFHLDIGDAARLREAFALAADIVQLHEVRAITVPWALSKLDEVAEAILGDR